MDQWETFNKDGIIFIEDAISDEDVQTYIDAIDRVAANNPKYTPGGYLGMQNIVERDPAFAGLIDHERHVGYAYDLFGELLKLHISQFFLRPPGGQTVQSVASRRGACVALWRVLSASTLTNQDWVLADGSAETEDGKPRCVAGQSSASVHGRLRYARERSR